MVNLNRVGVLPQVVDQALVAIWARRVCLFSNQLVSLGSAVVVAAGFKALL